MGNENNGAFTTGIDKILNASTPNAEAKQGQHRRVVVMPLRGKESDEPPQPEKFDVVQQESKMHCTTDYEKFNYIVSNREIDPAHVRRLAVKIKEKNLLHLNPGICNANLDVIEGQHRLEAAKLLGVPYYYIIDDNVSDDDIATLNSNKKNWSMMDYINYHASKGKAAYITFSKFCNANTDFTPSILVSLCARSGKRVTEDVHGGNLDVSNIEVAQVLIGYLKDFAKYDHLKEIAHSARFIEAIIHMNASGLYDHNRMMARIAEQSTKLVPCANRKQYILLLQEIYNYRARTESLVNFIIR